MTAGYNPFEPDRRSKEQRNRDDAEEFAEVLLDELVERIAKQGEFCFRVGADEIVDAFTELLAGTNLEAAINKQREHLREMNAAPAESAQ